MTIKTFIYNGELYVRLIPSKKMFQSTLIHEVVNRGDVFAMRVSDQQFTVIPGKSQVEHCEHWLVLKEKGHGQPLEADNTAQGNTTEPGTR